MSDQPAGSSAPADDFIHLNLEKSTTSSLTDSLCTSKSQYCQVVFHDLSEVYPTDGDICFTYSFQPGVIPQGGDRIALYKVGWSSVSEYITSIFANPPEDGTSSEKAVNKISFSVEHLPKDEVNMYQFCYITSGNIVAGSSIPFTFRKPLGNELVAVEDPNDSGLVVFRSRVTQLQEQLVKSNSEKEMLEKTIQELKSELYLSKAEINEKTQKCDLHKENLSDMTNVIYDLNTEKKELIKKLDTHAATQKEVEELMKQKESLEVDITQLKATIETLQNDITAKDATILKLNEKLEKSALIEKKITELEKCKESLEMDIAHLKSKIDSQNNDMAAKDAAIMGLNEGRSMCEQQINSLKEQLNMSNENVDELTTALKIQEKATQEQLENLNQKLKEMTHRNNAASAESLTLTEDLNNAKRQVASLQEIVKNKDKTLKDFLDSNSGNNSDLTRRLFTMEDENSLLHAQIYSFEENVQSLETENVHLKAEIEDINKEKAKMADQLSKMNEELRNLKGQSNHGQCSGGASKPTTSNEQRGQSPFAQFSQFIPFFPPFHGGASVNVATCSEAPKQQSPMSKAVSCEKCKELDDKIKAVMIEKADIRSDLIQTKHSNEEYCRLIREVNEEAAALKSRIAVLELELLKAKEVFIPRQGEQKIKHEHYDSVTNSWQLYGKSMNSGFESRLVDDSDEKQNLRESLQKEIETRALLQRNVEALMVKEGNDFSTIYQLKKENVNLLSELAKAKETISTIDEMRKALDDMDNSKVEMGKNLESLNIEKARLEKQLIQLRTEAVGKLSLTTVQQLKDENIQLKKQLNNQECCKKLREKLEAAGQNIGRITLQHNLQNTEGGSANPSEPTEHPLTNNSFGCPVCMMAFPPDAADAYKKHFRDHLD